MFTSLSGPLAGRADVAVETQAQFRAFGGTIPIPHSMEIDVALTKDNGLRVRMLSRTWGRDRVLAINLTRPSSSKTSLGDEIELLEHYSLNGFEVDLYQMDQSKWNSDIVSAQIERCGEWGQVIARTKNDIDEYLLAIDATECQER